MTEPMNRHGYVVGDRVRVAVGRSHYLATVMPTGIGVPAGEMNVMQHVSGTVTTVHVEHVEPADATGWGE